MSIHRTLHQEFRLPLFGVSFNPVEPVPQNVSVIRIEAPNGKAWIYRVSWDHPSNGQPDHYTLDISYTNHQGNRQDVLFNLGGNVQQKSYNLHKRNTLSFIELRSVKDGVDSEFVRILPSDITSGDGQMGEQTIMIILVDDRGEALTDISGSVLGVN